MANPEHVAKLLEGVEAWNDWRRENPDIRPDLVFAPLCNTTLRGANLKDAYLSNIKLIKSDLKSADLVGATLDEADLSEIDLRDADLQGVSLREANLVSADLRGSDFSYANLAYTKLKNANLSGAELRDTNLREVDLSGADLSGADLRGADLREADLSGADLSVVYLGQNVLAPVNLTNVRGLDSCYHSGPSTIDHRTLMLSGGLPKIFLRDCGWPDWMIEAAQLFQGDLPDNGVIDIAYQIANLLTSNPIQYQSCFISYSSKDQDFAESLYADLQAKGVRCWYAPHDLRIGDRFQDTIDQAVRLRDKLLVILSENSLASEWVEDEVQAAVAEERKGGKRRTVLFPLRIDDAVEETNLAWALRIKQTRHIGDFRGWKDHDAYQAALDRLLRDLRTN